MGQLKTRKDLPTKLFDADRKRERVLTAMDRVNDEWGEFTVYPASLHAVKEKPDWTVASIALHRGMANYVFDPTVCQYGMR